MIERTTIGDCVDTCDSWNPSAGNPDGEFYYIDIASIDRTEKRIVDVVAIPRKDAPSRARQIVKENDVLVSTVRPNLNAVAVVPASLDGATASTGFTVLRPRVGRIEAAYLFHWVRTPQFVDQMIKQATGASYPAVSDKIVRNAELPLPSTDEQRRIAAILDKADALRVKRREAIAKLDQLLQSVFLEMFGDPVANLKMWNTVKVGDVFSDFVGGKNVECPRESSSQYRILKVSAVTSGIYRAEESKAAPEWFLPPVDAIVRKGDLIFSRANTAELVAATVFVWDTPDNIVLPDKLWKMRIADDASCRALFLLGLFKNVSFRDELSKRSSGTSGSMKNISKAKLVEVPMPLPPVELQERFSQISERVHAQMSALSRANMRAECLLRSLQQRAFGSGVL